MKIKNIKLETVDRIQTMTIKHKSIKLKIQPKKLKFDDDADYGDEVLTTKYTSYIEDCEYDEKDTPYLNKLIKLMRCINKTKSYDAFKLLVMFIKENCADYKLIVTPYPDDISEERAKEMTKFVKKVIK